MKRKNTSLNFALSPTASRSPDSTYFSASASGTPGDISGIDPQKAFSRLWTWEQRIPEPENWDRNPVQGTITLGADDGATLKIGDTVVSVPDAYGPQGGSPYTSKTQTIELYPGIYNVSLEYFNINYNPPSLNVARLDFSLPGEVSDEIVPEENDPEPTK